MLLFAILFLSLFDGATAGEAKGKGTRAGRLEVMTQNLYVGANLLKIRDPSQPIPVRAADIFSDIQLTDFAQRAGTAIY